jgi:hypothetical protein
MGIVTVDEVGEAVGEMMKGRGLQGELQLRVEGRHDVLVELKKWMEGQSMKVLEELNRVVEVELAFRGKGE